MALRKAGVIILGGSPAVDTQYRDSSWLGAERALNDAAGRRGHLDHAPAVLRWSTSDDLEAVVRLAKALTSSPDALGDYLHSLMIVATHEPEVVPRLAEVWPQFMAIGLDAVANAPEGRQPRHAEKLIRSLVPSPSTLVHVENVGDVLRAASARWFPVVAVTAHIEPWLS